MQNNENKTRQILGKHELQEENNRNFTRLSGFTFSQKCPQYWFTKQTTNEKKNIKKPDK